MNKEKYLVDLNYSEYLSMDKFQNEKNYVLEQTECFIYNGSEMREFIAYEDGDEVEDKINSPQDLYKWAVRHFNKCHIMLIEKYEHTNIWYRAVELDYVPTCYFDSGVVGIIAVPKKRFRNPEKTKNFMRDLVSGFSKELDKAYYTLEVTNLHTKTKSIYCEVDSKTAYKIENAKDDKELEDILKDLELLEEYPSSEIA